MSSQHVLSSLAASSGGVPGARSDAIVNTMSGAEHSIAIGSLNPVALLSDALSHLASALTPVGGVVAAIVVRSEEHTSELQSLV